MRKIAMIAGLLAIGLGVVIWIIVSVQRPKVQGPAVATAEIKDIYKFDKSQCPAGVRSLEMTDVYMRGVLEKGQTYQASLNWYACHAPQRGDLVLYRYSLHQDPVVKRVVAVPGDRLRVEWNPEQKAWNLVVNDERIMDRNRPYFFGAEPKPPLKLYEEARGGELAATDVVVLSSFPPGDKDSSVFGVIALADIVAKVDPGSDAAGE